MDPEPDELMLTTLGAERGPEFEALCTMRPGVWDPYQEEPSPPTVLLFERGS